MEAPFGHSKDIFNFILYFSDGGVDEQLIFCII